MDHHHLLINSACGRPPRSEADGICFIRDLVERIDMEFLSPPVAKYCWQAGNRGLTAFGLITTSHVALHTWDETTPGRLQLDVYSCKAFAVSDVAEFIKLRLDAFDINVMLLDRGREFREILDKRSPTEDPMTGQVTWSASARRYDQDSARVAK